MRSLPLMPTGTNIRKEKVQNNASRAIVSWWSKLEYPSLLSGLTMN